MKEIAKKTLILRVLEILEKYSSKEHPVTITYIAKFLNEEDVPCDRRTIGRNIDYLIEYGKNIIKQYSIKLAENLTEKVKVEV